MNRTDYTELEKWQEDGKKEKAQSMLIFWDGCEHHIIYVNSAEEEEENISFYGAIEQYLETIPIK